MTASATTSNPSDPPVQIHLSWRQNDTAHTIVVTWKTLYDNSGDNVLYDTTPRGGVPSLYENQTTGSHHTYSGTENVHDVELTGLSPDTIYYFICGGENGGWSEERSFRTAPETSTNIRFVAGGDSRSGGEWPRWRDNISRTMAGFNPSFVLYTSDFVYDWDDQDEWDNWFGAAQEYWVDNDNLTIPIIPCIGNHEVYHPQPSDYNPEEDATNYYGQFCLPGNERWYSLNWGPDLHIIVLDSEVRSRAASAWEEQLSWLENDLAVHKSYKWKIVIYHRPSFTKSRHSSDTNSRKDWVPLFDFYHVDLVISGHNHCYERTDPINYTQSEEECMPSPAEGTIYVTSGGWGAPLYSENRSRWWTGYGAEARYNFVVVDIENDTLHLRAIGTGGETFDEYLIQEEVGEALPTTIILAAVVVVVAIVIVGAFLLRRK